MRRRQRQGFPSTMAPAAAFLVTLLVAFSAYGVTARSPVTPTRPSVIVVGAGMSGISAAKTLSDAGVKNFLILEATNRVGGRIKKANFAGVNVEVGANWVEGVNGQEMNPIWTMANKLKLRNFYSNLSNVSSNIYSTPGRLYSSSLAQTAMEKAENTSEAAVEFTKNLEKSGLHDISVLTFQRLQQHVPSTPLDMVVDYYTYDYEFAEPPRVTSLQNTEPLPTFADFGEDIYFVADQRGYETVVHDLAAQFLVADAKGTIVDGRLKLNQVVNQILYSKDEVVVKTEDGSSYTADYVMVSVSVGVLQTDLIKFQPDLPTWKILAIYEFDMSVYTKIFLKFPYAFWPTGNGTEFFLYASGKRGYYPVWQQLDAQYPGSNVLLVTVTDEESRRVEQQSDNATRNEAMQVLRDMFGHGIPEATHILVPRWWSDRFYRGTFSNWPIGVNKFEYDQLRAPVERVYFTGEHTSQHYNGYVHGAYISGIDSAYMLIACMKQGTCSYHTESNK